MTAHELPSSSASAPLTEDVLTLESFGYKQELKRGFSLFGMIGFAFSVLTCWTALAGSLVAAIEAGGPPVIIYSWIGVCFFSLFVAYSFAEICSAFPVAGGQYSWVAILTPPKWARLTSYLCGWFIVIGFLSAGAANGFIGASFVLGMAQLANPDYTIERWHTCCLCYLVLILAAAVNIWGRRLLNAMGKIMITFNLVSFIVIIIVILAKDQDKATAAFVFKDFNNNTGFSNSYASLLGILQAAFGMTGYDATAHMTEEMKNARHDAPKAIIFSVWIGALTGFAFLIAAFFCIRNLSAIETTSTGMPIIAIFYEATGSVGGAIGLTTLITVIALVSLCFLMAQSSRVIFSFARDHGLPFSDTISKVHPTLHVPVYSILTVLVVNMALMAIYFGSVTGFNTVLGISTEGFYLSYIMPLLMRIWGRVSGRGEIDSAYSLGRFGMLFNVIGILYLAFAAIVFNFPSTNPVNGSTMNYTSAAVGVSGLIATATWLTTGRTRFTGPQRGGILEGRGPRLNEDAHHVHPAHDPLKGNLKD
ncbi:amino acid transporter [Exophiala viscosa]|uniref:Amino acid transporter n=1 Tax=Exophiala viscosa TaxID=2486360 RepID=A0AAN6DV69_9EURO|nr:amino acid transporter [Exophiala viscosa]KAI1625761.1 amino acid transporter [Exophiala viscosa]